MVFFDVSAKECSSLVNTNVISATEESRGNKLAIRDRALRNGKGIPFRVFPYRPQVPAQSRDQADYSIVARCTILW